MTGPDPSYGGGTPPPPSGFGGAPPPSGSGFGGAPPPSGSGFGGAPPPAAERPRPPRPATVTNAARLMYAVIGLYVLSLLLSLVFRGDLVKAAGRQLSEQGNTGGISAETAATIGLVVSGLFTVVIGVAFGVLAVFLLRGRNWARITAAIVAGLFALLALVGVISSLGQDREGLSGAFTTLSLVLNVLSLLCLAAIPVLLFLRPSNDYFAPRPYSSS